jgi:hypothetical protein
VYTSTYEPDSESALQTLTCVSDRGTVAAHVVHQAFAPDGDLAITANPNALTQDGELSLITVTGGSPPYSYSLKTGSGELLSGNENGRSRVYRRTGGGPNAVTVTDSAGDSVNVIITQPAADLTITATPQTLSDDGDLSLITVDGGVPPYTYSVREQVFGYLQPQPGSEQGKSRVYVRDQAGDNSVTVTDSANDLATVIISQP